MNSSGNGARMIKNEKENETVKNLCKVITEAELNSHEIINVLINFLFSIGASMEEGVVSSSSEEILKKAYSEKPTIGIALMNQAIWIRDNWILKKEEEE
jgi:hypothetical protein